MIMAATALTMLPGIGLASAEIPDVVTIGGVFDITGSWSEEGSQSRTAAQYAVDDFNMYLEDLGADWRMAIAMEDSQGLGAVAFEKVQALKSRNIDLLVGMGFSSHLLISAGYVESNKMLVVSHGSQVAILEIDDNMFRLVPSDSNQAPAVVAMIEGADIEVLVPFMRDDVWGNGMLNALKSLYNGSLADEFRYNHDAADFSAAVSLLDEYIGELVSEHGADKVGVLYVGADEFLTIIESMKFYSNVKDVRWFVTNTHSTNEALFENEDAKEFVNAVMLTTTKQATSRTNHVTAHVDNIMNATSEGAPSQYIYAAYDSVWLLGTAILQTGTTHVPTLVNAIPLVAERMIGSAGPLKLTENGDLFYSEYTIMQASGGEFVTIYEYDPTTGLLVDAGS